MTDDFESALNLSGLTPSPEDAAELKAAAARLTELFRYLDTPGRPPGAQPLAVFDPREEP